MMQPPDLETRRGWHELLVSLGIRPSRALGQNFLVEPAIPRQIAEIAEIAPGEHVVEIGPGHGILTRELLTLAGSLTIVELDRQLAAYQRSIHPDGGPVKVIEGDFLHVPFEEIADPDKPWIVVANLPYSTANAIIRRLLEAPNPPRRTVVMVQKEVAERIVARPPDMSILTVAVQLYAEARIAFDVKPGNFIPPPKVDSSVVILDRRDVVPVALEQRDWFFKLVNAGFRHKRKTITNSLADILRLPKDEVALHLEAAGINPMRRAETLDVADWVRLSEIWPEPAAS